jgi:poly(ADP-ribose) glycohydrolase ARH3
MDLGLAKFIGSLIGTAVGDSLGARFEGATGVQTVREIGPRYTDDTAMTIGVAESLIENKGFNYWHMAEQFIKNYEREPWRRYGSGPPRIFRMMQSGRMGFGMLDRDLYPGGSFGNGAAMRIAPVGLLYHDDPPSIREISYHVSGITHSHELGLEGAALQACAVALAVLADPQDVRHRDILGALRLFTRPGPYQEKLKAIIRLLDEKPSKEDIIAQLGNRTEALHSVPTAIYSFLAHKDLESAVVFAVSLGGDTDTIAAMTGAIAGACYGIENIPDEWRTKVENRELIETLGQKLWDVKKGLKKC